MGNRTLKLVLGDGIDMNLASVSREDASGDVETQPRTLADAFGGEERLEDAAIGTHLSNAIS
jgi:hypothetical protein